MQMTFAYYLQLLVKCNIGLMYVMIVVSNLKHGNVVNDSMHTIFADTNNVKLY